MHPAQQKCHFAVPESNQRVIRIESRIESIPKVVGQVIAERKGIITTQRSPNVTTNRSPQVRAKRTPKVSCVAREGRDARVLHDSRGQESDIGNVYEGEGGVRSDPTVRSNVSGGKIYGMYAQVVTGIRK